MRRPFAVLGLVVALLPGDGRANHDRLPDPPPQTTSQKLPSLPNLDRTRHGVWSVLWWVLRPPVSRRLLQPCERRRYRRGRAIWLCRGHSEPVAALLVRLSGSGLGGSGGLHPLLWRPLLRPSSVSTTGRGFPQDHQRGGRPGSDRQSFQSRGQPGLAVPRQERCPCPAPSDGNP